MPRAFSEKEKERIRRLLLEEGHRRLNTTGVQKTTIEDFARAANISKGAFYKFYPTKEVLFFDVFGELENDLKSTFDRLMRTLDISDIPRSLKSIILETMFSEEVQTFFKHKDELSYVQGMLDETTIDIRLSHDLVYINGVYSAMEKLGITPQADPEETLAYLHGVIYLFFAKKVISDKYFKDVVAAAISTMVDVVLGKGE